MTTRKRRGEIEDSPKEDMEKSARANENSWRAPKNGVERGRERRHTCVNWDAAGATATAIDNESLGFDSDCVPALLASI